MWMLNYLHSRRAKTVLEKYCRWRRDLGRGAAGPLPPPWGPLPDALAEALTRASPASPEPSESLPAGSTEATRLFGGAVCPHLLPLSASPCPAPWPLRHVEGGGGC